MKKKIEEQIIFWCMIFLATVGELLILFAAVYIAIAIYNKSNIIINLLIGLCLVIGVCFKTLSEVLKKHLFETKK